MRKGWGLAWGNIYMAGKLRVNHHDGTLRGFPGYYFNAALFKVPIAKQVIFFIALLGFLFQVGQLSCYLSVGTDSVSYFRF